MLERLDWRLRLLLLTYNAAQHMALLFILNYAIKRLEDSYTVVPMIIMSWLLVIEMGIIAMIVCDTVEKHHDIRTTKDKK